MARARAHKSGGASAAESRPEGRRETKKNGGGGGGDLMNSWHATLSDAPPSLIRLIRLRARDSFRGGPSTAAHCRI